MSKIEYLRKLLVEATPGPWNLVAIDIGNSQTEYLLQGPPTSAWPQGFPAIEGYNVTENLRLVGFLRNNAPAILEVLEAADTERYLHIKYCVDNKCWHFSSDLFKAIAKLEGGE